MTALIQMKQKPQVCLDETKAYWLRVIPIIWPTRASQKKAFSVFKHQLNSGIAFNSQLSLKARVEAFTQLLKTQ